MKYAIQRRDELPIVRVPQRGKLYAIDYAEHAPIGERDESAYSAQFSAAVAEMNAGPGLGQNVLARLNLAVADETWLPSIFGKVRLNCQPESVNTTRITRGQCVMALDHEPERMVGFIEATSPAFHSRAFSVVARVMDVPRSREFLREARLGMRRGISPGFLIHRTKLTRTKSGFDTDVLDWEPYEISSTPIPRNSASRIVSEMSMGRFDASFPAIVAGDDPDRVFLQAARLSIREGNAPAEIEAAVSAYDKARTDGQSHDAALQRARGAFTINR